jgi:tetratricopeptide (TPR) repeat protein
LLIFLACLCAAGYLDGSGKGLRSGTSDMTSPESLWQMYTDSGKAYLKLKQYKQAESMLAAALQVAEQFGPQDQRLSVSLNGMARLRQTQKRYADAEQLYIRALAIAESERGRNHPDAAVCLSNLAGLLAVEEKYPEAEAAYKEALAIFEATLGAEHEGVVRVLVNYAALLRKMDRTADAEAIEARVKAIREKAES